MCVLSLLLLRNTPLYQQGERNCERRPKVEQDYLDSLSNEKVWLGNWTLKQCREMEISLGLDLKGGMNVILEVSVPDVIKALADNKPDEAFNNAWQKLQNRL